MSTDTVAVDREPVCEIRMPSGHVAIVDLADHELVGSYNWRAKVDPHTTYVIGQRPGSEVIVRLHRLLLNAPASMCVDHRDGNGLNNRRSNLRLATASQNQGNKRQSAHNTSGYKGVCFNKAKGKWQASIGSLDGQRHLGLFADPWEAAQAYNTAALEQWGEFARLNQRLRTE